MTPDPITVQRDMSLHEAHKIMIDYKIRRLPVMDGDDLVGIVTRGDIRGAEASDATSLSIWEVNYLLSNLLIERVMTAPVVTVDAAATVREAARLMLENKIAGLPVVEDDRLVGIITESDIFRMVVDTWEAEAVPA